MESVQERKENIIGVQEEGVEGDLRKGWKETNNEVCMKTAK